MAKSKARQPQSIPSADGGTGREYLMARLARDRPDILERMKAGEFASVRAAAIEAGIIKPTCTVPLDPGKAATRLLRHFKGEDLVALATALANCAGYDLVPKE
jgi:hypothetical protein